MSKLYSRIAILNFAIGTFLLGFNDANPRFLYYGILSTSIISSFISLWETTDKNMKGDYK